MKGDTVGETLYSAKWILNTLVSLTKIYEDGWNPFIESDLCILWDITSEKDIIEFLIENDFLRMAEFTLKISEEPRLTEIIVGIIGNLCCEKKSLDKLVQREELVSIILSLLSSDDKETLIQVLRILQAAIWDISKNPQSLWLKKISDFENFGEATYFILKSSTSDELLTPTINLIYLISEVELPEESILLKNIFDIDKLIISICESMEELIGQNDSGHSEIQFKVIENWLSIMFNIIKKNLLVLSDDETDMNIQKINAVLVRVLRPYQHLNNLIPVEENCLSCIQECIKMIFTFEQNEVFLDFDIAHITIQLMVNFQIAVTENEFEELDENVKHAYENILNCWIEMLKTSSKEQVKEILKKFDIDTINNIIKATNSFLNISESCLVKLTSAKSEIFSIT
ncbi:uncharacterized protein LOC131663217 isoform X2 [Phymastichus coffea]|nr:uncharacterized protein LOC131663217 isoform X2 [Phymastichus coffea]XP_058789458.1 uncharacterized protein LOC131663217 isoform X2 [Phymastichus coffea]